jgi:hypothetical protein
MMIEGSGSGSRAGPGSRRPKNMWIRWIRNTGSRLMMISEKTTYLVPDPGDEEKGGGEEEHHQGCGGLTLPHTCTERYLFSSQTFFYGENPWLHYVEITSNQFSQYEI